MVGVSVGVSVGVRVGGVVFVFLVSMSWKGTRLEFCIRGVFTVSQIEQNYLFISVTA